MPSTALVTFATLFIRLIHGPMAVEVVISTPVAEVRMFLDVESRALKRRLRWQLVAWVDGAHLPQDISLAAGTPGLLLSE